MTEIRIYPSLSMTFNPDAWGEHRTRHTNCYTYGLNAADFSFLDVGGLQTSGICEPSPNRYDDPIILKAHLQHDGLSSVAKRSFYPHREHIIAVVGARIGSMYIDDQPLLTRSIFHVFRLDKDQTLSEQGASCAPSNRTKEGQPITPDNYLAHFADTLEESVAQHNAASYFKAKVIDAYDAGFFRVPEHGLAFRVQP